MAIYYVAKTGNDGNPGTEAWPWLTIQHAANTIIAGDTVYVKNGTYNETVTPANAGAPGSYITYAAYTGHSPIIAPVTRAFSNGWAAGSGKGYLIIDGFEMKDGNDHGMFFAGGAHHVYIRNCTIHGFLRNGIITHQNGGGADYFDIRGCTIHNCGHTAPTPGDGIILHYSGHHSTIAESVFRNNGPGGGTLSNWSSGIEICGANYCTVEDNETYCNSQHGIDVCGDAHDNVVQRNTVYDCGLCGVALNSEAHDTEVSFNVIYGNSTLNTWGSGIHAWGGGGYGPAYDNDIYNNSIYDNGTPNVGSAGIGIEDVGCTGHDIRNNIMQANSPHEMFLAAAGNVSVEDYNCFFPGQIRFVGVNYNLAGYRIASGNSANSIDGNPRFENPAGAPPDFHLQEISPCIDAGTDVGYPYWGTAPDMGAFEFKPSVPAVPVAGVGGVMLAGAGTYVILLKNLEGEVIAVFSGGGRGYV